MDTAYIDFDHTLFDTDAWIAHIAKVLAARFSFTPEFFLQTRKELWSEARDAATAYSPESHARSLVERHGMILDPQEFVHTFFEAAPPTAEFLYPDALSFLAHLKDRGIRRVLLTWGHHEFQKYKVDRAELSAHLDDCILAGGPYGAKIDHVVPASGKTFFINDSVSENKLLVARHPNIQVVTINRDVKPCPDGACATLDAARDIIEKSL